MLNKPIKVKNLTKIYNEKKQNKKIVFENLNITFESGKIHCLLGKSGCGKSTLLKMLAGLESFNKGDINIGNLKENHLSMILQDNNLLPWLNTYQNIEFAVKANKFNIDKRDIDKILTEYELLEFSKNFPYQMSVGMKQKVSFAKTIDTSFIFSSLDEICSISNL